MSNHETAEKVMEGYRMNAPSAMPAPISQLMQRCWKTATDERPDFQEIHDHLKQETMQYNIDRTEAVVNSSEDVIDNDGYVVYNIATYYAV